VFGVALWYRTDFVMPGTSLVPGIHALRCLATKKKDVDGRDKTGHDKE